MKKWRFFKHLKLRNKLMLIYAVIGFFPVLAVFYSSYYRMRDMLRTQEEQSIRGYMNQSVAALESRLAVYDNLSDYIAFSQNLAQVVGGDYRSVYDMYEQISEQLDGMLQSLMYFHNEVLQVTIYSENSTVKHDTSLAPLSEVENEIWFDKGMESASAYWYVDETEKTAISVRRMPLLEQMGTTGLLYIAIDYDSLFAGFDQIPREDYRLRILDTQERLLFDNGTEVSTEDSVVFQEESSTGWKICFYQPRAEYEKALRPLRELTILTIVLCIAGAVLIFFFVSFFITRRIEYLTKKMQQVEEGNLQIRAQDKSEDEIGVLTRGFSSMVERIRILIEEVYGSKLAQKEYEMKALQNQINPHFLYNTLSMINWKAIEVGQEDISRVTLALSTFYRTALNKGKNMLTIKEEVNNIKSYLEIQKMMHDDSFDVEMQIDEEILSCETLNLILQPLVENAIEHGVDQLTDRRGKICITGKKKDNCVVLCVSDNGPGMDRQKAEQILTEESKGYGVRNVNERIRLYYGAQYAMRIDSTIGEGTVCRICFPAVHKEEKSLVKLNNENNIKKTT